MGLYATNSQYPLVDIPAIAAEMRATEEPWMNGIVQIIDPNIAGGIFDPWSNAEDGGDPAILWEGSARIQPLSGASGVLGEFQSTNVRGIRFKIPLGAHKENGEPLDPIRAGLQVYVVDGGEDAILEQYHYVINTGINSSLAWNRTIEATVDLTAVDPTPDPEMGYGFGGYGE